ncbi:MAG: hypothetical protein M0004_10125 [Actinomycetota bacterium]|nr:hypothetical protein [Actinomycetota bacterium]
MPPVPDRYALSLLAATLGATPALAPIWRTLRAEVGDELDWQDAAGELATAISALLWRDDAASEALEAVFSALEALCCTAGGALCALGVLQGLDAPARRRADAYLHPRSAALLAALWRAEEVARRRTCRGAGDVWRCPEGR